MNVCQALVKLFEFCRKKAAPSSHKGAKSLVSFHATRLQMSQGSGASFVAKLKIN